MPRALSESERQTFLAEPHIAVLSVANDAGRPPLSVPIWYSYEPGGAISFFTGTQGRKAYKTRLIQMSGRVSLTVQRDTFPYRYVSVEGLVTGLERQPTLEQMLAVVRRYLPEEPAQGFALSEVSRADSELVYFTVQPERWHSMDFSDDAE